LDDIDPELARSLL